MVSVSRRSLIALGAALLLRATDSGEEIELRRIVTPG